MDLLSEALFHRQHLLHQATLHLLEAALQLFGLLSSKAKDFNGDPVTVPIRPRASKDMGNAVGLWWAFTLVVREHNGHNRNIDPK